MSDPPHIPEVDEYRNNPWGMSAANRDGVGYEGYVDFLADILADAVVTALDARIAALEAENKRLTRDLRTSIEQTHEIARQRDKAEAERG